MPLKLAVITSVYNESDLLYQFLRHYTDQVDTIFVLDNESTDGSTSMCHNFPNVELSSYATGGKFDDKKKHATVLEKGKACAGSYDYVIYIDSDEFIVPKNSLSIRDTIECSGKKDIYGTEGWNIYEYPDDKPYDPTQPVLSQRQRGVPNEWYSKPCIVRPGWWPHGRAITTGERQKRISGRSSPMRGRRRRLERSSPTAYESSLRRERLSTAF